MRINFFSTWMDPARGGIENLCCNLVLALKEKHQVQCISLKVPETALRIDDVEYVNTDKRTVPFRQYLKYYFRENKKNPFDINIAIHWGPALCAYIVKRLTGTPYIMYIHGKEMVYFPTPMHKIAIGMVMRNAKYVVGNSQYTIEKAEQITKGRYVLIHPGIDEGLLDFPTQPLRKEDGTIRLFTVTRLIRRKGIHKAIDAVALLKQAGEKVEFIVGGYGAEEENLQAQVRELGLENEVKFVGRINTVEEKARYIADCDLVVMPSYEIEADREVEGFGMVYVEANALGRMVVAGNSGGIPDAVKEGETGFLVNGENPEEIRDAILRYKAMGPEQKQACSGKARAWAEQHSWKQLTKQLETLF